MWALFIIFLVMAVVLFWSVGPSRMIPYGKLKKQSELHVNTHDYYLEEVQFDSYNEALSKTFKIVEEVSKYGKAVDVKYDLYDWSVSIFQFEENTIGIKYFRATHSVQLLKSKSPISIADFEEDHPLDFAA